MFDVPTCLRRINYTGSTEPTAETLRSLHRAHLLAVPFENLDIHLGHRIILNEAALYEKIVVRKRGGFCYELNGLFAALLSQMGFQVSIFSTYIPVERGGCGLKYDHLTLLVDTGERWLVDVGYGDAYRLPLRLDDDREQFGALDKSYRFANLDGQWGLWSRLKDGDPFLEYTLQLDPLELSDFQEPCDYYQDAPGSYFTQGPICSRATDDGMISLTGDRLIVTSHGQRQEIPLFEKRDFTRCLIENFGMNLEIM
jgi:N-hydroxyarylamine O-acetyltransferase